MNVMTTSTQTDTSDAEAPVNLHSRRSVINVDGLIIVAYNTSTPYPAQHMRTAGTASLRRIHLPHYESNEIPYLCAAPAFPDYSGVFLERLRQTDTQFDIVRVGSSYSLNPDTARSWLNLECLLEDIAQLLIVSARPFIPLNYRYPPSPRTFGYLDSFNSRSDAVTSVQRARDAFQGLIAHASWAAILHRHYVVMKTLRKASQGSDQYIRAKDIKLLDERWARCLSEPNLRFHPAWLNALKYCTICDFETLRAGIVIRNPKAWNFTDIIPTLILSNVPVWLIWGKPDISPSPDSWTEDVQEKHGPTLNEITHAYKWKTEVKKEKKKKKRKSQSTQHTRPVRRHIPPADQEQSVCTDIPHSPQPDLSGARDTLPEAPREGTPSDTGSSTTDGEVEASTRIFPTITANATNGGMEILEWITAKKDDIRKAKAIATEADLHSFKQREREAAKLDLPGSRGATVYEWDRDLEDMPIRILVGRKHVPAVWLAYQDRHRWYNCVADEWELCYELEGLALPLSPMNSLETLDDEKFDKKTDLQESRTSNGDTNRQVHRATSRTVVSNTLHEDLIDDEIGEDLRNDELVDGWRNPPPLRKAFNLNSYLSDIISTGSDYSHWHPASSCLLEEVGRDASLLLTRRFGFSFEPGTKFETVAKKQWTFMKAMRVVGDAKERGHFHIEDGLQAAAIQFVMHLDSVGHPETSTRDIPPPLCDLYPLNYRCITRIGSRVSIRTVDVGGTHLYIIHHAFDTSRPWLLAVHDPLTALQALRTEPWSLAEFALLLLRSRTAFRTLSKVQSLPPARFRTKDRSHTPRRHGLGERPPGHILDQSDYVAYISERTRLLENERILRAAVKRGGILSRLVGDNIDECQIIDGPSRNAAENPFEVTVDIDGKPEKYIDDNISEEEIATLVGLYSIRTGTLTHLLMVVNIVDGAHNLVDVGCPPSEQSWWPTAMKFEDSGLNVGVWTPKCEEWFMRRCSGSPAGGFRACSASQWRTFLRFEMETKRVYKGAKLLASRYIEEHKNDPVRVPWGSD